MKTVFNSIQFNFYSHLFGLNKIFITEINKGQAEQYITNVTF